MTLPGPRSNSQRSELHLRNMNHFLLSISLWVVAGARVLRVSQPGNQNTLYGLYDIMQTLEAVPLDGPRKRKKNSFVLIVGNATIASKARVGLANGKIKGFALMWPDGDAERRRRLISEMDKNLVRVDAVWDPTAGSDEDQAIDMVSDLEDRKPAVSRSEFYIDSRCTVVTATDSVGSCAHITVDILYEATSVST